MKKFFTFILVILALVGAFIGAKKIKDINDYKKYVERVKSGWYLEVLTDELNVREEASQHSYLLDTVKKGEVLEILDYEINNTGHYWYKVKLRNTGIGWVANPKKRKKYVETYNGTIDVATPTIKYNESEYHVISIKDIKYDHLTAWDDSDDYEITHIICHEVTPSKNINQYWIKYTITDASGKSSSKRQKIIFEKTPSEDDVVDFYDESCS